MNILYLLVPLALSLAAGAVLAFRWAATDRQFDDLDSPSVRMLDDGRTAVDVAISGGDASETGGLR